MELGKLKIILLPIQTRRALNQSLVYLPKHHHTMETTVLCGPMAYQGGFPGLKPEMDPKERFYRHFEAQATALQEDIANLANISATGGERKDATDHVLGGISRLTNEVSDASEYAPPRDQMIYGQVCPAS